MSAGDPLVIFTLLGLLVVKHLVADFVLQSRFILDNRRHYGHPGGLVHVGFHLIGTAIVLWIVPTPIWLIGTVLLVEAVVHYHLDWMKDTVTHNRGWTVEDTAFWVALGADQALHHLSYLVLVYVWWILT